LKFAIGPLADGDIDYHDSAEPSSVAYNFTVSGTVPDGPPSINVGTILYVRRADKSGIAFDLREKSPLTPYAVLLCTTAAKLTVLS